MSDDVLEDRSNREPLTSEDRLRYLRQYAILITQGVVELGGRLEQVLPDFRSHEEAKAILVLAAEFGRALESGSLLSLYMEEATAFIKERRQELREKIEQAFAKKRDTERVSDDRGKRAYSKESNGESERGVDENERLHVRYGGNGQYFGDVVRDFLVQARKTQSDYCRLVGVSVTTFGSLVNRKRNSGGVIHSDKIVARILDGFKIEPPEAHENIMRLKRYEGEQTPGVNSDDFTV